MRFFISNGFRYFINTANHAIQTANSFISNILPKSAAALSMSLPISLIQSYVLDSHFLKPLNTDLALDHAGLEIASKRSWALGIHIPSPIF